MRTPMLLICVGSAKGLQKLDYAPPIATIYYIMQLIQYLQKQLLDIIKSRAYKFLPINSYNKLLSILRAMGNNPPPQVKPPTMQETIMEMRMAGKRFQRESTKAQKEEKKIMEKAKGALRKNNQEGAKMYLQAAATKHNQALSAQRMGIKMDTLVGTIKASQNNQVMMGQFNKITNLLQYSQQPNIEVMANDLERFENTMDNLLVNAGVMNEIMNKNTLSADSTAEAMMEGLKREIALDQQKKYQEANKYQQIKRQQQQDQEFQNKLRDL